MKATKILTVLTLILLVCSLVACNEAGKDKANDGDRKKGLFVNSWGRKNLTKV